MDLILLSAGRGTRLRPITDTLPKPLVPVADKGTLLHTLDMLPDEISQIILIVGYLHERIRAAVGTEWKGRQVTYVLQAPLDGTGGALRQAQPYIATERFMVVNGDDLYGPTDIMRLAQLERGLLIKHALLTAGMNDVCDVHDGKLNGFNRLPRGHTGAINTGAYTLGHEWFDTIPIFTPGKIDEWSLPHALPQLLERHSYDALEAEFWMPCGTSQEIQIAAAALRERSVLGGGVKRSDMLICPS